MLGFALSPWVVVGSSNSVAAALDGVDRWVTDANLVWNQPGGAHSWIVLRNPSIPNYHVLLSCNPLSGGSPNSFRVGSCAAGYTGGTTLNDPTGTDSGYTLLNGGSGGSAWINVAVDFASRWSVMQSTDGQCTRVVMFAVGNMQYFWAFDKLNFLTLGTPGAANTGVTLAHTTGIANFAGITAQNGVSCTIAQSYESQSNLTIQSEISGTWDIFPVAAVGSTVGGRGRIGVFQDMWIGSTAIAPGDGYPAAGPAHFIQVSAQGLIIPWNDGPINTS
jgi:hypothetical protein